ncbi:MAG TPA: aminotransferase class I/II-fold pyridoxal phosphate-dependent enzyme, partial [Acidimicrobiales bacterium]
ALLDGTDAVVLLDEAYADYSGHDALSLTEAHENLVVVRTLSKAYGLASLRVGYAIGSPAVIGAIAVSRGPYKVGALAEAVALGVLEADLAWVRERIAEVVALRDAFSSRLRAAGHDALASSANFVAVRVDDAVGVLERMLADGVLVRAYPALPVFGDLVRITVAPQVQLDEAFEALEAATR